MRIEIYNNLYNNRLLRNNAEIENYERCLALLADSFTEDDIIELCSTFDDNTQNSEVMFNAIHLLETLSTDLAFINTICGVVAMNTSAPEWGNIIIYRCLNDDYSVNEIKKIFTQLEDEVKTHFAIILKKIKEEDYDRFGEKIDYILG